MRWLWLLFKLLLVAGLLLAARGIALPWVAEQAYLGRTRPGPALAEQRITPQNTDQILVLEKWLLEDIFPAGYRILDVVWQTEQQAVLLATHNETLLLASFPPVNQVHTWLANPRIPGADWQAQFNQDGQYIVGQYANQVRVYNAQTGHSTSPWMPIRENIVLSPDGKRLAWAVAPGLSEEPSRVGVYNTEDGSTAAEFKGRALVWRDLAYSPDGVLLVALGEENQPIAAWMGRTPVFTWLDVKGNQVAISQDGLVLATSQTITYLKNRNVFPLRYPPPAQTPWGVAFSPGGDVLVTQTIEGGLYFWRVSDGALLASRGIPPGQAKIAFSPDGAWFCVLVEYSLIRWGLTAQ